MEPLFEKLKQLAIAHPQRIILPESTEERNLIAADRILSEDVAKIILIGHEDEIFTKAKEFGLTHINKATIVNPDDELFTTPYAESFYELRKKKGVTMEEAKAKMSNPIYLGCMMIKHGDADGLVSGAIHATADVLRPALQIIKTKPGISCVSGAFIMMLPEATAQKFGEKGIMVFGDCAVMPNPTADELAQIAVLTAATARNIAGIYPRVAMLSYSTKGSAKSEVIDKVVKATAKAREMDPKLQIDGELQADAAIVQTVADLKAPDSNIAGRANVLIFPNLEVGNIGYKLVQRFGGVAAVGPVLQGLAAPVNDLSRGCNADDIYKTMLLTINQAINKNNF